MAAWNKLMKMAALISFLLVSLYGCVNPVSGLQKTSDFSLTSLKQDGIEVALVTSSINNESEQATQHYDAVLARTLTDKLKVPVKSNQCLSKEQLTTVVELLKQQSEFTSAAKSALSSKPCPHRYLVLARVERDEISQRREVRQDYLFLHQPGMVMQNDDTVVEVNFIRERKVTSAFWVIDSRNGNSVWQASITESEPAISRNSRVFPSLNMLNQIWADDYIKNLSENNAALYPAPVTREKVWEILSSTFAKHLNQ